MATIREHVSTCHVLKVRERRRADVNRVAAAMGWLIPAASVSARSLASWRCLAAFAGLASGEAPGPTNGGSWWIVLGSIARVVSVGLIDGVRHDLVPAPEAISPHRALGFVHPRHCTPEGVSLPRKDPGLDDLVHFLDLFRDLRWHRDIDSAEQLQLDERFRVQGSIGVESTNGVSRSLARGTVIWRHGLGLAFLDPSSI